MNNNNERIMMLGQALVKVENAKDESYYQKLCNLKAIKCELKIRKVFAKYYEGEELSSADKSQIVAYKSAVHIKEDPANPLNSKIQKATYGSGEFTDEEKQIMNEILQKDKRFSK